MNSFVLGLSHFLDAILNWTIFLLIFVELGISVWTGYKLYLLNRKVKELNQVSTISYEKPVKENKHVVVKEGTIVSERDWAKLESVREDYRRTDQWYTWFTSLIQVFPLLGILGTVAGLYIAFQSGDMNIYDGVQFALSTTILGLIAAIIFKIVDAAFRALFVNSIEEGVDRFEKGYMAESERAR